MNDDGTNIIVSQQRHDLVFSMLGRLLQRRKIRP